MVNSRKRHGLLSRVPRLQLFVVLEVAAREGSFTRAAHELGMTQSGVSRQISQLERTIGQELFDRTANRVVLNSAGRELVAAVEAGFDKIEQGLTSISLVQEVFVLAANPGFAQAWLVPHLASLREALGGTNLHLLLFDRDTDLEQCRFDCAISLCADVSAPAGSRRLLGETVFPVASPEYAARHHLDAITKPSHLATFDLLHLDGRDRQWMGWTAWFAAHDVDWSERNASVTYSNHALVLDDAAAGRGIALAWEGLTDRAIAANHLVAVGPELSNDLVSHHAIPAPHASEAQLNIVFSWLDHQLVNAE